MQNARQETFEYVRFTNCMFVPFSASPLAAVRVQHPAPDFKGLAVVGNSFQEVKLEDYRGKYLVLFFYPLDL